MNARESEPVVETFADELDDHIVESLTSAEYLAAHDAAVREEAARAIEAGFPRYAAACGAMAARIVRGLTS